jgi:probable rRNA maturation factor
VTVDCVIEDERWTTAGIEELAARATAATLSHSGLEPEDWEIVLLAADDARVAALNGEFRGMPAPTNVLSWPSCERATEAAGKAPAPPDPADGPELGDIALAWETCAREAAEAGLPIVAHVTHLIVHGTLHLLGYDHVREEDADLMERFETEILASLGIPDPY